MPEGTAYLRVDGEWSMVETLRHLIFVHDSWFRRCVLGLTVSFDAIGLGPPSVPDLDRTSRPNLGEVPGVRERQAMELDAWLRDVLPDELARTAPVPDDNRWPTDAKGRRIRHCLGTVLNEEFEHHGFCIRDLNKLATRDG